MLILRKKNLTIFVIVVATYSFLLSLSLSELNPDWVGYKAIYQSEGAWLEEGNRDPLFVSFNKWGEHLFGQEGYFLFRGTIATCFLFFLVFLSAGKLIPYLNKKKSVAFVVLAILSLGYLRFTIQIREGIALTLFILSYGLLIQLDLNKTKNTIWFRTKITIAYALMCLALLVHSAMAVVLAFYLFSVWVKRKTSRAPVDKKKLGLLWFSLWVLVVFLIVQIKLNIFFGEAINSRSYERESFGNKSTIQQYLKITLYGVLSYLSFNEAIKMREKLTSKMSSFLMVLTGPAQSIFILAACVSIIFGFPSLIVGDFTRQFLLLFNISCLLLAFFGGQNRFLVVGLLLSFIDGIRAVLVSVYTTYDIKLIS